MLFFLLDEDLANERAAFGGAARNESDIIASLERRRGRGHVRRTNSRRQNANGRWFYTARNVDYNLSNLDLPRLK